VAHFDLEVERLRSLGWYVDDLGAPVVIAFRTGDSSTEVLAAAAEHQRAGTVIHWHGPNGEPRGRSILGYDELGPDDRPKFPAVIVWPDHREESVADWDAAAARIEAGVRELVDCFVARGAARVESLNETRRDGFEDGWLEPTGTPLADRGHPLYMGDTPILDAAFREGAADGIEAAERLRPWHD
jgi:hypothetical protein